MLSVLTFRTLEEAVEKANNTMYGLSAGVWTDKGSRILKMSTRAQGRRGVGEHVQQVRSVVAVRRIQGIRIRARRRAAGTDRLREDRLMSRAFRSPRRRRFMSAGSSFARRAGGFFLRMRSGRREAGSGKQDCSRNIPQCTRKDLRNAVEAAAKAGPDWAKRTPYNRGQIIYRLGEMLESRSAEMAECARDFGRGDEGGGGEGSRCQRRSAHLLRGLGGQVRAGAWQHQSGGGSVLQFHGGRSRWGSSASSPTMRRRCSDCLSQIAPVIVAGNTVRLRWRRRKYPYPAIVLGEMLAVSDLPGGVVNILTGFRKELVPTFATHTHIRGVARS